jgi:hypothetical protein
MTTDTNPAIRLLELTTEAQDLLPDHTYKALMLRVDGRELPEEKCELLGDVLGEFKRRLPG